jgi:hypothetical protein
MAFSKPTPYGSLHFRKSPCVFPNCSETRLLIGGLVGQNGVRGTNVPIAVIIP